MVTTSQHIRIGYEGGSDKHWIDVTIWSRDNETDGYTLEVDGLKVCAEEEQLRALAFMILEITR